jgi:hypothetical protein
MESIQADMRSQVDRSNTDFNAKKTDLQAKINPLVPDMAKAAEEHKQVRDGGGGEKGRYIDRVQCGVWGWYSL